MEFIDKMEELETMIWNEVTQTQKDKCNVFSLIGRA